MPQTITFLKSKYITFIFLALIITACQNKKPIKNAKETTQVDSIKKWINQSKLDATPLQIKVEVLEKATKTTSRLTTDSVKSNYFTKLSLQYLHLRDSLKFRKANRRAIEFNKSLGDSSNLAEVYIDLGVFFTRYAIRDSTYFHYREAQIIFEVLNNQLRSGQLLRGMAGVESMIGDYTNCEVTLIKAIEKLKPLNDNYELARCYRMLADNARLLDEPDRALSHYSETLSFLKKADVEPFTLLSTKGDMGLVYQKQGQHKKAVAVFSEVLAFDSLLQKNPQNYGRVLGNLGYSYLKMEQYKELPDLFIKAQTILDSINDIDGKSIINSRLAEFYLTQNDSAKAIANLQIAKNAANESSDHKYLLEILGIFSRADPKNAAKYMHDYINLNDSLQLQERAIRNKFARIRYETDEFIAENEVLSKEKQLWTGIAASLVMLGFASFIIISQRVKNQKLRFAEQQQVSNQEIFNLLLAQNEKVEEGKKLEQKRVSEELHDGVLGKMLGTRMMLLGLNKKTDPEAVAERAKAISILQEVESEVRSISHELSHAAYQKIHNFILSIKDLLQTVESTSKINIDFSYADQLDYDALNGNIKINLYRIIQESVQNAVKHAECKNINLIFTADVKSLKVLIVDDGKGFLVKKGKKGIGMRNIASRMQKVNGTWGINSDVGKGTSVSLNIPMVANDTSTSIKIVKEELQEF